MGTVEDNVRSRTRRGVVVAFAAVAASATLAVSVSPAAARADHGRHHHRGADVTFTKWVIVLPTDPVTLTGAGMIGVVGGDVGRGDFAGEVLGGDVTSQPGFWLGHARYEFHGHKHFFVADVHPTEDDGNPALVTATIDGVVTQGWMRGAEVTGEYTQYGVCPLPTPGNVFGTTCFQGTLHLQRGHRH